MSRIARVALATAYEIGGYNLTGDPHATPTVTPTPPLPTPTPDPATAPIWSSTATLKRSAAGSLARPPIPARYVTSPVYSGLRAVGLGMPPGVSNRVRALVRLSEDHHSGQRGVAGHPALHPLQRRRGRRCRLPRDPAAQLQLWLPGLAGTQQADRRRPVGRAHLRRHRLSRAHPRRLLQRLQQR